MTICCVFLVALASCASGLKFTELNPSTKPKSEDTGRIFFYRPTILGAALRPNVVLNGETVGEAISQGFFYVDRPPGNYEVVINTEVERKVSFVLEKGQTRFVRFSVSFGSFMGFLMGYVYGDLVDEDEGLEEIKDCKYTGKEAENNK